MPADDAASLPSVPELQRRIDELSAELRESKSRHALVSDAVAEGIYEWNIETNALWVSPRLIEIFGFEGHELKAGDWNELVHSEDFSGYRRALRDCFKAPPNGSIANTGSSMPTAPFVGWRIGP